MTGETHAVRRSMLEKAECVWRIDPDALVTRDHRGVETRDRWGDVTAIRIASAPTRYQMWRHILLLTFKGGIKRLVQNSHFVGIGNFENRAATYAPFVREALRQVQKQAPNATARIGAGPIFYWSTVIILGLLFAGLAALLMFIPFDELGNASPTIWVKIGILAVLLPVLFMWARKSYPRVVPLAQFPESALPAPE